MNNAEAKTCMHCGMPHYYVLDGPHYSHRLCPRCNTILEDTLRFFDDWVINNDDREFVDVNSKELNGKHALGMKRGKNE